MESTKDVKLSLDTDTPDKVADILRYAAHSYRCSQLELQEEWGDETAGREWGIIARILDKAADAIESKIA